MDIKPVVTLMYEYEGDNYIYTMLDQNTGNIALTKIKAHYRRTLPDKEWGEKMECIRKDSIAKLERMAEEKEKNL